jgi:hypothetical protein
MTCTCTASHRLAVAELRAAQEVRIERGEAPDSFAAGLLELAPPLSTFEEQLKASRLKALEAERADVLAHEGPHRFTTLDASDLERYRPPNPYTQAIAALKEREARR